MMERTLDEQKICFITAVTDREVYQRSLASWQRLRVPEGMTVQYIAAAISPGQSAGRAYQLLMGKTDAKYKVYIRQEVELVEVGFLEEAVAIFRQHPEYGMAGAAGSINLPEDGIWYKGDPVGCIWDDHQGKMQGFRFPSGTGREDAVPVMLLEGCLLMTQHDVGWQNEFFEQGELYAASQCMAFRQKGLEVVAWSQLGMGIRHWGCQKPVLEEAPQGRQLARAYKAMVLREQPLVSIIVPVYNVKPYLQECVDSLLAQSYKKLEIILVDDCSTDGSRELMEQLYGDKPQVVLLHHEENKGATVARSTGLGKAQGKYVVFVDSDDFVEQDYIEILLLTAEAYQADIAACGARTLEPDGSHNIHSHNAQIVPGGVAGLMKACDFTINLSTCDKIISRKMLVNSRQQWICNGLEDILLHFRLLYYANKYISVSALKYNIRHVEGSQSQISFGRSFNFVKSFFDILYHVRDFLGEVKKHDTVTREQENAMYDFIMEAAMFNLYPRLKREGKVLEEALSEEIASRFGDGALYVESILRMAYRYKDAFVSKE